MVFMMKAMSGGRSGENTPTTPATEAGRPPAENEVVRLRAELDQLKAEREHRAAEPADPGRADERT
jgi:hypothetical protein